MGGYRCLLAVLLIIAVVTACLCLSQDGGTQDRKENPVVGALTCREVLTWK